MDLSQPLLALSPGIPGRVLGVLERAEAPLSGSEIARRAGLSRGATTRALQAFETGGPVWSVRLSHADVHLLDPEHLVTPIVRQLASIVDELVRRIRTLSEGWEIPPSWVALVDPAAQADPGVIEVLLGRPTGAGSAWRDQLAQLDERVGRWTGATLRRFEFGANEDGQAAAAAGARPLLVVMGRVPPALAPAADGVSATPRASGTPVAPP